MITRGVINQSTVWLMVDRFLEQITAGVFASKAQLLPLKPYRTHTSSWALSRTFSAVSYKESESLTCMPHPQACNRFVTAFFRLYGFAAAQFYMYTQNWKNDPKWMKWIASIAMCVIVGTASLDLLPTESMVLTDCSKRSISSSHNVDYITILCRLLWIHFPLQELIGDYFVLLSLWYRTLNVKEQECSRTPFFEFLFVDQNNIWDDRLLLYSWYGYICKQYSPHWSKVTYSSSPKRFWNGIYAYLSPSPKIDWHLLSFYVHRIWICEFNLILRWRTIN